MELLEFGFRIGAALLAGLFIGMEREIHNKNAGLKTNALVSLGAAVFVLTSLAFEGEKYVDTTRVIGQVVTGIGFLGAGVILHKGTIVRGLTTAATVWCSAGAGCLAAIGQYKELFLLVAIIVFVNVVFNPVDRFIARLFGHDKEDKIDD
ncbi:putative Mg2+ transporter-C (MgtC) family protein [Salinimicrobium sediminis]|uniref:Putative Mg2+ transporter-C (MgtC) family protein n=1 Tax=Salinimicrobium sediminis TaxID=1343891 RepID=A0A285X171_9FLAO|nr:MgtC/SapB family protein [Salinimicrobium sediminis]MDX1753743.1 MgtC/SapB family protein [Salinimicrobium sediminis]SOC79087.1 putative Mg2+ transporter-C (MgtC) family protein [Salinimicrobium sediminis]